MRAFLRVIVNGDLLIEHHCAGSSVDHVVPVESPSQVSPPSRPRRGSPLGGTDVETRHVFCSAHVEVCQDNVPGWTGLCVVQQLQQT